MSLMCREVYRNSRLVTMCQIRKSMLLCAVEKRESVAMCTLFRMEYRDAVNVVVRDRLA